MTLRKDRGKIGHLSEESGNPVDSGRGRSIPKGQPRVGYPSADSSPESRGGKRELPNYTDGEQYNTGLVGSRTPSVKRAGDLVGRSGRIAGP